MRQLSFLQRVLLLCSGGVACTTLSGCLVAGYSSSGGAFIWPGGLGLGVILLVLWLLFRSR